MWFCGNKRIAIPPSNARLFALRRNLLTTITKYIPLGIAKNSSYDVKFDLAVRGF